MRVLSESIYRYAEIRYAYGEHRATRWLLTVLVQFFLPRYALVSPHQWGFLVRLFPLLLRRRTRPLLLILVFRGSSVCFHSSSHLSFSPPPFLSLSFSLHVVLSFVLLDFPSKLLPRSLLEIANALIFCSVGQRVFTTRVT